MSDFLPQLAFLAVGGSIAPPLLLLAMPFLGSQRPLLNATALALVHFTTCAVMGVAGLALFGGAAGAGGVASVIGCGTSATVSGLLIVLGLRSLIVAPDPEAQPQRWIGSISSISPPRAFGFGMALFPTQIKNLAIFVACLELIAVASLSPRGGAVALGLTLLVFAIPVLGLIGLYAAMPQRASTMLGSLRTWMEKNSRTITVVLASCSERSSGSEASRDRKTVASRTRSAMSMLERVVLTAFAGAGASRMIACPSQETPFLQGLHRSGMPHTIGGYGG